MLLQVGIWAVVVPFAWAHAQLLGSNALGATQWLRLIDVLATVSAAVILLSALVPILRAGTDATLLRSAPQRRHTFGEYAVTLALLSYVVAVALLQGISTQFGWQSDDVRAMLLVGSGGQAIAAIACLVIAHDRFAGGATAFVFGPSERRSRRWVDVLLLFVVAIGVCPAILDLTVHIWQAIRPLQSLEPHATLQALHDESTSMVTAVLLWTGAAVVAPVAEELFFRGLLQTTLVSVLRSRVLAVVVTAALFGLVHWAQFYTIPALFVLGLLLGYAYEKTGSLLPAILIHSLFNLKTLIWDAVDVAPPPL